MTANCADDAAQRKFAVTGDPIAKKTAAHKYCDAIIVALLFSLSFAFAFAHVQKTGLGNFYQPIFSPALVWACTGKFESLIRIDLAANPELAAVYDFNVGKIDRFNCKDLPASPLDRRPLNFLQYQTLYLIAAVAAIWTVAGIKWAAVILLAAFFAAVTSAAVYGICRLFLSWSWASAATMLAVASPANVEILPQLRDYAIAPFILVTIFLCGSLLRLASGTIRFIAIAALTGVVAGLGIGVRPDSAMIPVFFGMVLMLITAWERFRNYRNALLAATAFVAAFVASAFPTFPGYVNGSTIGHVVLLGLTTPFNAPLGLNPTVYDIGDQYSDESIVQFTEEFAIAHQSGSDARPIASLGEYGGYDLKALSLYALHFPADVTIRAYSSALQTIALHFGSVRPPGFPEWLYEFKSALTWHVAAPLLFFLFIAVVAWSSIELAVFLILAFSFFAGLGALQFHYRHVFYQEFWYWLSLVGVVACCARFVLRITGAKDLRLREKIRPALMAFAVPSVALAVAVLLLVALRIFQSIHVPKLIEQYLSDAREPVRLIERRAGDHIFLSPAGTVRAMSGADVQIETAPFEGYYFDAVIDAARCPDFTASIDYNGAGFARVVRLLSGNAQGDAHLIFPVLNSMEPLLHPISNRQMSPFTFAWIDVSAEQRPCLLDLRALSDYKSLPLPLWLQLPPNWREMPLYQTRAGDVTGP